MSGIYVRIKPPEFCSAIIRGHLVKCPMYDVDGYCAVMGREAYRNKPGINLGRPDWCPIIPVSDHGDLIDRDALLNEVADVLPEPWDEESAYMLESGYSRSKIYEAETIIPADKEAL